MKEEKKYYYDDEEYDYDFELYLKKEKQICIKHMTNLLCDLLMENYLFKTQELDKATGENIFNIMYELPNLEKKEEKQLIINAMKMIEIKYGYDFENNYITRFKDLKFDGYEI